MALKLLYVVCECGQPEDVVEYDDAAVSGPVQDVMNALNVDENRARQMVAEANPGAELTGEENGRWLADRIARRDVPDRAKNTYRCSNGHLDTTLSVTDQRPAPPVPTIIRTPATVADRLSELDERGRK